MKGSFAAAFDQPGGGVACTAAEGVETEEQSEILNRLGCDFQGFLLSKPVCQKKCFANFLVRRLRGNPACAANAAGNEGQRYVNKGLAAEEIRLYRGRPLSRRGHHLRLHQQRANRRRDHCVASIAIDFGRCHLTIDP
ncbi:EAL domain-containing protein (plasmid) [Sinorhizobium meliloti]|nr:EAL domain-containing protein [Sinorhizobium meliloti]MCM5693988.1 EAL domain-containing protein [Sinorhizobium meliloti]WQO78104.1 EAL domain-containing protein [Sinorhizobium meliloti]